MPITSESATITRKLDPESAVWVARLQPGGASRDAAIGELHALMLRAARFEVRRREAMLEEANAGEREDLAQQSADDALMAVLRKLGDFRGESRFTTWAYKFALLEAAVKVRRRAWREREVRLEPQGWSAIVDRMQAPHDDAEARELIETLQHAVRDRLTAHQREVLVAIALEDVPIDVLAERLATTRGALYKTLHDARRKLRAALAASGIDVDLYLDAGGR